MAFGGYTRDMGSFGEETDKITTLHRSGFKNCSQSLETASQFLATPSDHTRDSIRKFMMTSEHSFLKRNPRRFGEATASENLRRSISTWEDLTTRFLAQFFPPGRTAKLRNDILMFQQHQGESLSEAWTAFQDLLPKSPLNMSITSERRRKVMKKGDPENINTNPPSPPDPSISFITEKVYKDDSSKEELGEDEITLIGGLEVRYFDIFPTKSELTYHKYLMSGPIPSLFLRNPIIAEGCPSNLKIPCNIGHVHMKKAYINLNSLLNIMTRMQYNWIMRKQLKPGEDPEGIRGIRNFTERIKGMHIFVGNFTYVSDFMIIEDISSIIDPRLSQVVLGKPFVEICQ
ncbi:MAK10-like protein [Tanacetum coccineum]